MPREHYVNRIPAQDHNPWNPNSKSLTRSGRIDGYVLCVTISWLLVLQLVARTMKKYWSFISFDKPSSILSASASPPRALGMH